MPITILNEPGSSKMLDYHVNIFKDGTFVKCYRFEGYSGRAVHDEIPDLRKTYPRSEGYEIEW